MMPKTEQQDCMDRASARVGESFDGYVILGFKRAESGEWTVSNKMKGSLLVNTGLVTAFLERMIQAIEEDDE